MTGIARDAGVLWDASIGSDAVLHVSSGGAVTGYAYVYGGAEVFLSAGATARELEVKSGAKVVDDGELDYQDGAGIPFAGTLLGTGVILESGVGTVVVSGDASAFRGEVVVDGGTVLLADMGGLGRATVGFVSAKYPSELQLDSAATPVSGTSILTVLSNFSTTSDELDLTGVSYTSGASAKVADGVLTLRDGAYRTRVKLAGAISSAYVVMADSSGGTLITAAASAGTLVEAAAGFEARFPGRSGVDEMAPPLLSESLVGGHAAHLRQA